MQIAKQENDKKLESLSNSVLGAIYRQQGDFELALAYNQRALSLNEIRQHQQDIATSARILGELYLHRVDGSKEENLKRSHAFLQRARKIHATEKDVIGAAMTTSHIGEHHYQRKRFQEALAEFELSREQFTELAFPDGIGRSYINSGFAYGDMGQSQRAISDFNKALEIYGALGDREWTRIALFGKAQQLEQAGEFPAAVSNYKQSVDILESIRSDVAGEQEAQELFTSVNAQVYENLVSLLAKQGDLEGALEYVERSRLRALRDYMLNTRSGTATLRNGSELGQLEERSKANSALARASRSATDPATQQYAIETLALNQLEALKEVRKLNNRFPGFANTLDVVPNTRRIRLNENFPDDLAIVTYFVTKDSLYVFVARKGQRVTVQRVMVSRATLRALVTEAMSSISNRPTVSESLSARGVTILDSNERVANDSAALHSLYELLVEPIVEELSDVVTIAVLPFDYLSYLPFEALVTSQVNSDDAYFLQKKQIVYIANQSYTDNFLDLLEKKPQTQVESVVAFGNPSTGNSEDALPFAQLEVSKIKEYFPSSVVYMTDQATKKNFIDNWGKHEILHIAAHARLTDNGSEILLAPGEAGVLAMDEMFDLSLNEKTKFIALSACQTGVDPIIKGADQNTVTDSVDAQQIPPGVPLASTVHAFSLVGVPFIVATLWNIDDQASAILMSYFYEFLQQGHSYYPALRMAKLRMIKRTDKYSKPFYWAPFVFYGLTG